MASDFAAPTMDPRPEVEPSPLAAQRTVGGAVGRDLESIFGAAPARPAGSPASRTPRRTAELASQRRSHVATAGGIAAAAFAGLAAGALLMTSRAPVPAKPAYRALPVEIAAAKTAPAPGPIDPVPLLAAPITPAAAASPPPLRRPATKVVRAAPRHAARACCAYAQMAAADRRLRAAYAEAVRAGAPRPLLVSYHARWVRLRREGAREPRRLVEGYGTLAAGLHRAAAEARAHPRRYADRRGWRPRFAPWWS